MKAVPTARLREASAQGRLRCPCVLPAEPLEGPPATETKLLCLAPLSLSHRGGTWYFAHKPGSAAPNCPGYFRNRPTIAGLTRELTEARAALVKARGEATKAQAELSRIRTELPGLQPSTPVLLVPLTREMLDHPGEIREPSRVLFVIPEPDLPTLASRLGLIKRPEMPAPLESGHIH